MTTLRSSKKARFIIAAVVLAVASGTASAILPVTDAVAIATINAGNVILGTISAYLYTAVTAITHNTGTADANTKVVGAGQQEVAKLAHDAHLETARSNKVLDVSNKYQLAHDPCTTGDVSDAVDIVSTNVHKANASFGGGGGVATRAPTGNAGPAVSAAIKETGPGASPTRELSSARTASQHVQGQYCTADESAGAGTKIYCTSVGSLPNADVDPETVFRGAGAAKTGNVTRTFNDDQMTALQAYIRNFGGGSSLGAALTAKQAQSPFGPQYLGMQKELEQLVLLAKEPLAQAGARSTPQSATLTLMNTIMADAPGSKAFYTARAAAAGGYPKGMSWSDLLDIDVMRRYGNGDWYQGMSTAAPEAVARENMYMQAQANYLAAESLKHQEKIEILLGALLASEARKEYVPKLDSKRNEMQRAGF